MGCQDVFVQKTQIVQVCYGGAALVALAYSTSERASAMCHVNAYTVFVRQFLGAE